MQAYEQTHQLASWHPIQAVMPDILMAAEHAIAQGQAACSEVWSRLAYFAEGLAVTERALALPVDGDWSHAYKRARSNALITLVRLSVETAHHDHTLARCEEALDLFGSIGDERGIWAALHQLAWQHGRFQGLPRDGWTQHTELLERVRRAQDVNWTAIKLTDLAVTCCFVRGEFAAALRYAEEATDLFRQSGDDSGLVYALSTKGSALRLLGQLDEAEVTLTSARAHCAEGWVAQRSRVAESLGRVSLEQGDAQKAVAHFNEAVDLATRLGAPAAHQQALMHLGLAESAAGLPSQAEIHLCRALAFFDTPPIAPLEQYHGAMCCIGLARIMVSSGRRVEAEELLAGLADRLFIKNLR